MASSSHDSPDAGRPADAEQPASGDLSMAKIIGGMALFVVLGFPLVGYLWDTLNDLLALEVNATRLLIAVPVAALLAALLWLLIRAVEYAQGASGSS